MTLDDLVNYTLGTLAGPPAHALRFRHQPSGSGRARRHRERSDESGTLAALVLYGRESESHTQAHDPVLAALGEPRYRQLVDQGATMTYEEAIAWARSSLGTQIARAVSDDG